MKKTIIISLCCVLLLCGCSNQKANFYTSENEQLEKEIMTNLNKITEVSDLASSNPYDYTKNEYYNNLISLGNKAIPVFESMYNEKKITGLDAYISALAIQDITKCDNIKWDTAEEFYELLKKDNCK